MPTSFSDLSQSLQNLLARPYRYFFKKYSFDFGWGIFFLFFTNLLDTLSPLAIKYALDAMAERKFNEIPMIIAIYAALTMAVAAFRYSWRVWFGRFHHSVADELRTRLFARMSRLGPSFFQKHPVGDLMSVITNDVNTFRMGIGPGLLVILDGVFLVGMTLPVMIFLSWDWTWKTLIFLPVVPFIINRVEKMIHLASRDRQDSLASLSAFAQEIVTGIRVIKSYAQEKRRQIFFDKLSHVYELDSNRVAKIESAFQPVMEFGIASGGVILLYFCSNDVIRGAVTLGTFVAYFEYIKKMVWPMTALGMGISMVEQGHASLDRIFNVLQAPEDVPDLGKEKISGIDKIEFRNLSYMFLGASKPVLNNISVTLTAGETIGLVGPVGAGKSTLIQLLCRMYPAPKGSIFINGIDACEISKESLYSKIAYVPQEAFLFSQTIRENIGLGLSDITTEAAQDAAEAVYIHNEIATLPDGYEASLGERGVNLSGGQKQRLTIARALARKAPLIILDDSLSAVDMRTEKKIVDSLRQALSSDKSEKRITIIISHRIATLMHADRVMVLNNGELEAVGRHEDLLRTSPTYKAMAEIQLQEENSSEAST